MLLAIDVGNTATKIAIGTADGTLVSARGFLTGSLDETFDEELERLLEEWQGTMDQLPCAVASVVPRVNPCLESKLARRGMSASYLKADSVPGIEICYETPQTLGADRIANAVYISEEGSWPAISVDFGTATKIDFVGFSNNELAFLGGAILPGVRMAVQSLSSETAQLPEFDIELPQRAIGRSTKECLIAGAILGHAKSVEGLIAAGIRELGLDEPGDGEVYDVPVVATGGLANFMAPLCPSIGRVEPYLTLEGLLIAARRWLALR